MKASVLESLWSVGEDKARDTRRVAQHSMVTLRDVVEAVFLYDKDSELGVTKQMAPLRQKTRNEEGSHEIKRCLACNLHFPSKEIKRIHEELVHT